MSVTSSSVAVFEAHAKAEEAIRDLQKSGFDMTKLSIIGEDYDCLSFTALPRK